MINGNEMISERYTEFSEYLLKNIAHDNIDEVEIKSVIGACAEFEGAGITKNSMVFPNLVKPGESISVKFSNVKFSLRLAFDIVLLNPTKPVESKTDMIQFIVKILKMSFGEMVEMLDVDMTTVLKAVYMLSYDNHGASMDKIVDYVSKNGMDEVKTKEVVDDLEKIKCISLNDGEYTLAETIVLNL